MARRLLAAGMLCLLLASAGCSSLGPGGGGVDEDRLAEDATYDWDTAADVTINVSGGYYRAVYEVDGRSRLAFSRFQRLNDRQPLPIGAVAFRFPNGTVVGAEAMAVEANGTHVTVTFPGSEGQFAFRVRMRGKELRVATATAGSYEVVLPPDTHVRYPLLGRVDPGGYQTSTEAGRVHVRWDEVTANRLTVRYYLVRDLWIFAGIVGLGVAGGIAGIAYFWTQLRGLRRRVDSVDVEREEP